MRKREAGEEERNRLTHFKDAVGCPSAVVQRVAWQKMICMRGLLRVTGALKKAITHFAPTQTGPWTTPSR